MGKKQRDFEYELQYGRITPQYARLHLYDCDDVDSKMAHILYDYLSGNSNYLPSFKLVEKASRTKSEKVLSQGYGIELSTDFVLTSYKKLKNGFSRIDRITEDSYISYITSGSHNWLLDLTKYPIFDNAKVIVVQNFLKKLKELYPVAKIK